MCVVLVIWRIFFLVRQFERFRKWQLLSERRGRKCTKWRFLPQKNRVIVYGNQKKPRRWFWKKEGVTIKERKKSRGNEVTVPKSITFPRNLFCQSIGLQNRWRTVGIGFSFERYTLLIPKPVKRPKNLTLYHLDL